MRLEVACALLVIAVVTIGTSAEESGRHYADDDALDDFSTMMMGGAFEMLSTMMCRAC